MHGFAGRNKKGGYKKIEVRKVRKRQRNEKKMKSCTSIEDVARVQRSHFRPLLTFFYCRSGYNATRHHVYEECASKLAVISGEKDGKNRGAETAICAGRPTSGLYCKEALFVYATQKLGEELKVATAKKADKLQQICPFV